MTLSIIVLAAGQGKRMHSSLPKVLHRLAGRPLLAHVLQAARALDPARTVVVHGHGGADVKSAFADADVTWIEQAAQQGTGHAVMQALPEISLDDDVLILYGDVPLIEVGTLRRLVQAAQGGLAILSAQAPDPAGYGRVVRGAHGEVLRIVEQRDAGPAERELSEVNAGFLCAPAKRLAKWLAEVRNHNAQKEYYLTDVVALAVSDGVAVAAVKARAWAEV
ncbi:MAG: NTP transferase domain-containing protein, partial [Burkholderiales bacterium]